MKLFFTDDDGFAVTKKQKRKVVTTALESNHKAPVLFTWEELCNVPPGDEFVFDCESYKNYFLTAFKHVKTRKVVLIEDSPDVTLNRDFLAWMLHRFLVIGFNSLKFDLTIIALAMRGMNCIEVNAVVKRLIPERKEDAEKHSDILKEFGVWTPTINHIDLIEVCPLQGSLKKYAAKLHCEKMQDLPYHPDKILTQAANVMASLSTASSNCLLL